MSKNRTLHPHHREGRCKFELIRSTRPSQRGSRQTFERVSEPLFYKLGWEGGSTLDYCTEYLPSHFSQNFCFALIKRE